MTTAADRGREMRARLLHAAAELIAERGWTGVSTRMLAERAGVAPGVIHYHFASVQALLTEAALAVVGRLIEQVSQALRDAQTPADALRLMLGFVEGYDGTDPTSLLFAETYLAATRDEKLGASLGEVIAMFRRHLADQHAGQLPRLP
jgi:AcrR family transcriptional regulator